MFFEFIAEDLVVLISLVYGGGRGGDNLLSTRKMIVFTFEPLWVAET